MPDDDTEISARDVWRELTAQRTKIDSTATQVGLSHDRLIGMEKSMEAVAVESRKTSDFTQQLVQLARKKEERESAEDERQAAAEVAEIERVAAAERESANLRARTLGSLVAWWTENWKTIAIAVALILGVNVTPLLRAFGMIAPVAVVAVEAPAIEVAPSATTTEAPAVEAPATEAPVAPAPTATPTEGE